MNEGIHLDLDTWIVVNEHIHIYTYIYPHPTPPPHGASRGRGGEQEQQEQEGGQQEEEQDSGATIGVSDSSSSFQCVPAVHTRGPPPQGEVFQHVEDRSAMLTAPSCCEKYQGFPLKSGPD